MKVSRPVFVAALFSSVGVVCIVGAVGMVASGGFGSARGAAGATGDDHAKLAALIDDLGERLDTLEAQMHVRRSMAGRSERPAAPAGEEEDTETVSGPEGGALSERVGDLESRVRSLQLQVGALSEDPVSRGFSYIASENRDLRRRGIRMLERLARSDPEARDAIRNLLDDPDGEVREEAIEALEDVNDRESIPRIMDLLADPESDVRGEAIDSLAELLEDAEPGDPTAEAAAISLAERLSDPDPNVRERAADSLGDFPGHAAVPALLQSLQDTSDDVREQAIDSLADLQAASARAPLRKMYDDNPGQHRMDLAVALRRLGDNQPFQNEVTRLSEVATNSADENERRRAIRNLGRFDEPSLRPVFEQALGDPSRRVRREAEEAIEDIEREDRRRGANRGRR